MRDKKVRLKKQFGIIKAGAIFELDEENKVYHAYFFGAKRLEFPKSFVEEADEWFEEVKEEKTAKHFTDEEWILIDIVANIQAPRGTIRGHAIADGQEYIRLLREKYCHIIKHKPPTQGEVEKLRLELDNLSYQGDGENDIRKIAEYVSTNFARLT